jgi:hypothetical protein
MTKRRSLATLSAALVFGAACAWPSPERQLLLNFFQACRVYDTTVLARMATASCNPQTDGVVQAFDIVSVENRRAPAAAARPNRHVTIRARVRPLGGPAAERTLAVTLEQIDNRWMVTSVTPLPASQTSPAASSALPR